MRVTTAPARAAPTLAAPAYQCPLKGVHTCDESVPWCHDFV